MRIVLPSNPVSEKKIFSNAGHNYLLSGDMLSATIFIGNIQISKEQGFKKLNFPDIGTAYPADTPVRNTYFLPIG